MVSEND